MQKQGILALPHATSAQKRVRSIYKHLFISMPRNMETNKKDNSVTGTQLVVNNEV